MMSLSQGKAKSLIFSLMEPPTPMYRCTVDFFECIFRAYRFESYYFCLVGGTVIGPGLLLHKARSYVTQWAEVSLYNPLYLSPCTGNIPHVLAVK